MRPRDARSPHPLAAPCGAAVNLYDATLRGGLADLRRMPSALIDEGPQRRVHRYLPLGRGGRRARRCRCCSCRRSPRRRICFDLRRGCSVAEHLLQRGHATYLVDYGPVRFGDRSLGLEHWIDDVDPGRGPRRRREDAGGRPVQLVGWCLGGILALLARRADRDLPVASLALVASPFDFSPGAAASRRCGRSPPSPRGSSSPSSTALLGGAPAPLVKRGYQLAGIDKYLMKPWTVAHATCTTASCSRRSRRSTRSWTTCTPIPGGPSASSTTASSAPTTSPTGRLALGDRDARPRRRARARCWRSRAAATGSRRSRPATTSASCCRSAPSVQLETAPGGHLGVLTGRAARGDDLGAARRRSSPARRATPRAAPCGRLNAFGSGTAARGRGYPDAPMRRAVALAC